MDQQLLAILSNISVKLDQIHEILLDFDAAFLEECEEDADEDAESPA